MVKDLVDSISVDAGGVQINVNPGLFINNQFVPSADGQMFETVDPATEKTIARVFEAKSTDVDKAVAAAEKAFGGAWSRMESMKRGKLLQKLSDLVLKHGQQLARLEALDNGKPFRLALAGDVRMVAESLSYYAGWASKIHGKTLEISPNLFAYTRHEPIGVCGCIIPWNFPLLMVAWKLGPLLACGNVAVLKTSEKTPLSALYFAGLVREAGFPAGVVNILSGFGPTAGQAIASHMKIRKVAFTGSTATGKLVMEAAAKSNLKKVTVELGGKSPNIIFDDCNLKEAVSQSVTGLFLNSGQVCCAGTRIFVQEGIYDTFLKAFTEATKRLTIGSQWDPKSFQGPLVDKIQYDKVIGMIKSGEGQGARALTGGSARAPHSRGYFVRPTVFADARDDAEIATREIFGPVGVVQKFKTEKEVIRRANDTEFGLAAAVFTRDSARAIRVSHALRAGTVFVNKYGDGHPQMAFGGYKQSGIGREGGEYALQMYTEVKQVIVKVSKL
eukprot:516693_1